MEYLSEWIIMALVFGVAVISPGPDFVMAVRNSVVYSRKAGIFTAIGFALGVAVHVTYSIVGIAALIASSVVLFNIIKYIGAAYLIYIGYKSLRSKGFENHANPKEKPNNAYMSALVALRSGLITNLFNPKATMFFLALFTQILNLGMPVLTQIGFGATYVFMTVTWFSLVAIVLTDPRIKQLFLGFTKWIDRIAGGLLIALGVRLAVSKGLT